MNILHEKRKLLPMGNPQEPISMAVAAMGLSGAAATIATGAITGGLVSAVTGGSFLKGALAGALFAGVGEAFSAASSSMGASAASSAPTAVDGVISAPLEMSASQVASEGLANTQALNSAVASEAGNAAAQSIGDAAVGPVSTSISEPVTAGLNTTSASTGVSTPPAGNTGSGLLGSIKNLGIGDKTGAALITAGGQAISGYAQGKQQEALYNQKKADSVFAKPVGRGLLAVR